MNVVNILGTKVACLNYSKTLDIIEKAIKKNHASYISVAAVHLVMECFDNPSLRIAVNRSLCVTADGMPLVWIQRFKGNVASRVYGPELTLRLCQLAQRDKWKIFIVGGAKGQGNKLISILKKQYPRLKIVGSFDTPLRPIPKSNNHLLLTKINTKNPDLIFVGLGCPYQERWMIQNQKLIKRGVMIGVGAAFDFITGIKKQAPCWVQNIGFEWLFRLLQEPKRLGKRYTITNIRFIFHFLLSQI